MNRVVITGIGVVTPLGNDMEATWQGLTKGLSGIGHITRFDAGTLPSRIAGELKGFCPEDYLPKKDILKLDPFIHYAAVAALMAVEDSKLKTQNSKLKTAGVIVGSSRGGIITIEQSIVNSLRSSVKKQGAENRKLSPYLMPSTTISMASSYISMRFGIKGPAIGISTACASGATAIIEAVRLIRDGEIDLAIAGGSEAPICRLAVGGYSAAGALSKRNEEPGRASRPFDKDRDGFVISEGAGLLVLERLEHALKRDAKVYAEIAGYGTSSDAFHPTMPCSGGEAIAINRALKDARLSIGDIDYINAHATSTISGDRTEAEAIKKVFGRQAYEIPISASKSMLGHMLGGAGAVEVAITALSLSRGIITPTINLECPDIDLNYVRRTEIRDISIALSNSFGFGGVNAVLILRRFEG